MLCISLHLIPNASMMRLVDTMVFVKMANVFVHLDTLDLVVNVSFFSAKFSSLYLQFRLDHQCEGNPECNGHGKCNINTGHCICDSAYTGKDCSQTATILKKSNIELNCSKHNYCNITNEVCDTVSGLCICAEGYFGDNCQQSKCCENLVFC